jgi:hypothetical protein
MIKQAKEVSFIVAEKAIDMNVLDLNIVKCLFENGGFAGGWRTKEKEVDMRFNEALQNFNIWEHWKKNDCSGVLGFKKDRQIGSFKNKSKDKIG